MDADPVMGTANFFPGIPAGEIIFFSTNIFMVKRVVGLVLHIKQDGPRWFSGAWKNWHPINEIPGLAHFSFHGYTFKLGPCILPSPWGEGNMHGF